LILVFAFFYVGIVFNPTELADNMRKKRRVHSGILLADDFRAR